MLFRLFTPLLALLLTASAFGGEGAAAPATQPAKGVEGYRYLDVGSWIVIESHVRTNGTPATMKRRIQITADAKTHQRSLQEFRWVNDAFVPTGEPQVLARADRRSFDQLGFTPDSAAPDQVVTIGGKRYVAERMQGWYEVVFRETKTGVRRIFNLDHLAKLMARKRKTRR